MINRAGMQGRSLAGGRHIGPRPAEEIADQHQQDQTEEINEAHGLTPTQRYASLLRKEEPWLHQLSAATGNISGYDSGAGDIGVMPVTLLRTSSSSFFGSVTRPFLAR